MSFSNYSKLSQYFAKCQSLRLSASALASVAGNQPPMTKMHNGVTADLTTTHHEFLDVRKSSTNKTAYVFCKTSGQTICVFQQEGPTNFAPSRVQLAPGVWVDCIEQLFKLHCVASQIGISDNCEEVTAAILCADTPVKAKRAPYKLSPFNAAKWDTEAEAAMATAIAHACTVKETFHRFQQIGRPLGKDKFMVAEAMDDPIWGVNMFTEDFLNELLSEHAGIDTLFYMVGKLSKGKNQLGKILTQFFEAIYGLTYEEFMQVACNMTFVEIY